MTAPLSCEYCGVKGAAIRRAGEPPTCYTHRDLPAIESERERELDRLVDDLYEGARRSRRREPQSPLEG
jgi:hypothetical protein